MCNVYYYENNLQLFVICILSIVRYILSMYAKILQPFDTRISFEVW